MQITTPKCSLKKRTARVGTLTALIALIALNGSSLAHNGVQHEPVDDLNLSGSESHSGDSDADLSHWAMDESPTLEEEKTLLERIEREKIGYNPAKLRQTRISGGKPHLVGQWGTVQDWPVIGVFTSLLADGRVLAFDSVGSNPTESYRNQDFSRATVWDPTTNRHTKRYADTGYNVFCSGFASLPDGRLFIAGGNADQALRGLKETHTFNPLSNQWARGQRMDYARWYPAVTPLYNGEMLITGGGYAVPEVREFDGTIRKLTNGSQNWWNNRDYPWLQTAPNGRTAFLGPNKQLGYLNTSGAGRWQSTIERDNSYRSYGSYAMYDIGKVLVAGGGYESGSHSQRSARIINLYRNTSTTTNSMNHRRRQHNLTVLADGSVLATGGFASNQGIVDLNNSVYEAELWNPANGTWTRMADESRARNYHSTALLLPDGRVLSAGGGICGTCQRVGYMQKNAQIFSPAYLFKKDGSGQLASRPVIKSVSATELGYDRTFTVTSDQARSIKKVALVRNGSVTHSQNMEQRYIPLKFTVSNNTLTVTPPANSAIAPLGHYMMYIIDNQGVPSVSKILKLGFNAMVGKPDHRWRNFAHGRTATQSSTYDGRTAASNAVDGNTNGNYMSGSITHTKQDNQGWLEIDLGSIRDIRQVSLFNRTDCCSSRLSNFHVILSEQPFISKSLPKTLGQKGVNEIFLQR